MQTQRGGKLRGVVTAIVAVTGIEDSVQDIIVPGAFKDTLRTLRPKFCYMHDWKDPIGRVLRIVELAPGDRRLPAKVPDGRPWPAEAGAVIAVLQFHLDTTRGRDMFVHCREWAKNNEAAFSIGYKVLPNMATKGADGIRRIYALALYEVSLVLQGAHNMALALEVKNAPSGDASDRETKTNDGVAFIEFPSEVKAGVPGVADTPSDHAAVNRLRRSWSHGAMAAKIGWGTDGDFYRCVDLATEHMGPEDAKGWCNLRHKDALGYYPATHAAMEGKAAGAVNDALYVNATLTGRAAAAVVLEAKSMASSCGGVVEVPAVTGATKTRKKKQKTPTPAGSPATSLEVKTMQSISGSYEALRVKLNNAVSKRLNPRKEASKTGPVSESTDVWVSVDATFPDRVIATRYQQNEEQSYAFTYEVGSDGEVTLGDPQEVELNVVVTADGDATPEPVDAAVARRAHTADAVEAAIMEATARLAHSPIEVKDLGPDFGNTLLDLLDQLAVKGVPVTDMLGVTDMPPAGDDEDEDEPNPYLDPEPDSDEDDEDETGSGEKVSLDPDSVRAEIAALRA